MKLDVIFTDTDTALRLYPDIIKEHIGTVIPPSDNKFASLNSAVWSGGSFVYVPEGVRVEIPLQACFRYLSHHSRRREPDRDWPYGLQGV